MKIENANERTDSSDLGVRTGDDDRQDAEHWRQQVVAAESDRGRAYAASEWIRAFGDLDPVEGGELRACNEDFVWTDDGTQALREKLRAQLQEDYSSTVRTKTKEHLLAGGVTDRDKFGMPGRKVAVENGLLDLETEDLRSLRRGDRVLWKLPVEYDPEATCPEFKRVLKQWLPDDQARDKIQEFVGYALDFNNTDQQVMLMLVGPTETGKSTFLDVIEALFGKDNTTAMPIQYLANDKWGVAELEHVPVNMYRDLSSSDIRNAGLVKELASGEPMKAERKGQDPYTLRPNTKHMFSANRVPECTHTDDAFYNRWLMIEFDQQVPDDDEDKGLDEKLTTPDELSGILNWAVKGYQRLQTQQHFTAEREPDKTRALWQKNGGSIDRFIHDHINTVRDAAEPKEWVYTAYKEFANSYGAAPESKNKLTRKLKTLDGVGVSQRRFNGTPKHAYIGVKLTNL